jgi:hypothetical protein
MAPPNFQADSSGDQFADTDQLSMPGEGLNKVPAGIEYEAKSSNREYEPRHGVT